MDQALVKHTPIGHYMDALRSDDEIQAEKRSNRGEREGGELVGRRDVARSTKKYIWLWYSLRSLVLALKPSFRLLHQGFLCCSKGRQTRWEGTEEEARLDKQAVAEGRREEGEVLLEATVHPGTTVSARASLSPAAATSTTDCGSLDCCSRGKVTAPILIELQMAKVPKQHGGSAHRMTG
ncbi:hypothetical protein F7725_023774 [Dissostichus mawsoni]|uniref:Uncharacterized protein n=1 Tax=Dissostichus mawsoni TaxID=36200 RepID=A0A7J5XYB6_DISMA|nr:hypothetical protein F7725_023774 [Dissostichus mawsoni]